MMNFPQGFLWGAATSSYQVEGNNSNADWWQWEKKVGKENSGEACRHYQFYVQDFDLARSLNHNAHRLSIEWSRVEPREGEFSQTEIQHYVDVIKALRSRQIEPVVTFHHFTNPIWLTQMGGWEHKKAVGFFVRFCEVMTRALARDVHFWITINEPTIFISHAYLFGAWPPQKKSFLRAKAVHDHLIEAHLKLYPRVHAIYREMQLPKPAISISQHVSAIVPCSPKDINQLACRLRDYWFNFEILDKLIKYKTLDFIGVNYYSRQKVDVDSWWIGNLLMQMGSAEYDPVKKNSLGWDIYPQGLYQVLMKLKKYQLPIMITENGICTDDDSLRWEFLHSHLENIHRAISDGVNVTGYLYWSLLDNFEWDKGFTPRFGLIDVDYTTFKRTIRDSARKFSQVCATNTLA